MSKKAVITIIAIIVILAGGYLFFIQTAPGSPAPESEDIDSWLEDSADGEMSDDGQKMDEAEAVMEEGSMMEKDDSASPEGGQGGGESAMMGSGEVKEFKVSGSNFKFSLNEMRVKKGDKVGINFSVAEGFHDWTIDEFGAKTKQMAAGGQESIEFVADKVGSFEYYCSVGQHRQLGMVGKLIVE